MTRIRRGVMRFGEVGVEYHAGVSGNCGGAEHAAGGHGSDFFQVYEGIRSTHLPSSADALPLLAPLRQVLVLPLIAAFFLTSLCERTGRPPTQLRGTRPPPRPRRPGLRHRPVPRRCAGADSAQRVCTLGRWRRRPATELLATGYPTDHEVHPSARRRPRTGPTRAASGFDGEAPVRHQRWASSRTSRRPTATTSGRCTTRATSSSPRPRPSCRGRHAGRRPGLNSHYVQGKLEVAVRSEGQSPSGCSSPPPRWQRARPRSRAPVLGVTLDLIIDASAPVDAMPVGAYRWLPSMVGGWALQPDRGLPPPPPAQSVAARSAGPPTARTPEFRSP